MVIDDIEREFIEFAYYQANFSGLILEPFDKVIRKIKSQGRLFISSESLVNQEIMINDIKGSAQGGKGNKYTRKAWIDFVIEEGYLKDDIIPLFYELEKVFNGFSGHDIGRI